MPNWLLFLTPAFIWGSTWLIIKFQFGIVAPEVSVVYRFSLAALILLGWCLGVRESLRFPSVAHARFALLGALQFAVNYVLVYLSEEYLTSGLVAVVFALMVFWNLLGAWLIFGQVMPRRVLVGAACGIVGVALVFWPELAELRGDKAQLLGLFYAVLATLGASAGNLGAQRLYAQGVRVLPCTAWSMLYGAIAVLLFCVLRGIPFTWDDSPAYGFALAYLTVFGSVFAFIGYLTLLQRIGAGRAGYINAVIPIIAMIISTIFEDYVWTAPALTGMALVLCGNLLVLWRVAGKAQPE